MTFTLTLKRSEVSGHAGAIHIVKNEGLHTLYHEQQASPKRCPKCGLLDIGRHICPETD